MKQLYIVKRSSYSREPSGAYVDFETAREAAEAFDQSPLDITAVPLLDTPKHRTIIDMDDMDEYGFDPMAKGVPDGV